MNHHDLCVLPFTHTSFTFLTSPIENTHPPPTGSLSAFEKLSIVRASRSIQCLSTSWVLSVLKSLLLRVKEGVFSGFSVDEEGISPRASRR